MSPSRVVPFACVCDGREDSLSREIIKGLLFALVSGKGTLLVSSETAGTLMGAELCRRFYHSNQHLDSAPLYYKKKHLLSAQKPTFQFTVSPISAPALERLDT